MLKRSKTTPILNRICEICEEAENTAVVNEEYYKLFTDMSEKKLKQLIRVILFCSAKLINDICFNDPKASDENIENLITLQLEFLMSGYMRINDEAVMLTFVKPIGPGPTEKTARLLDEKMEITRPLILPALMEILEEQAKRR